MMHKLALLALLLLLTLPNQAFANPAEEYKESLHTYLAAASCMAAYQGRNGNVMFTALEQEGWMLQAYQKSNVAVDAKFFLMRTTGKDGLPDYLLAVAGTESAKDIGADLRWGKIPYGGRTRDEFDAYSQRIDLPQESPKVHKGFHQYVQSMLALNDEAQKDKRSLIERLRSEPNAKLLIVGHSLGGAAAMLLGARIVDMGFPVEKLKIITFGAPPVGNAAFAKTENGKLQVVRYINRGDPIPYSLVKIVGGYQHFGTEAEWAVPRSITEHPHSIAAYLDYALKNYYDKRQALEKATKQEVSLQGVYTPYLKAKGFVAPLQKELPAELESEFYYMNRIVQDQYWRMFAEHRRSDENASFSDLVQQAKLQKCDVLLLPKVTAKRVRTEERQYYLTLQLTVYRVADENLIGDFAYGSNTKEFTPVEALLHNARSMAQDSANWLHTPIQGK
ncbi:lipase family protein [Azotosporobacter soli]|uniref:lipase family protein n=1 Tax=Azotosporobacter soli TaxID=3055040 RepID=UPI0031FE7774